MAFAETQELAVRLTLKDGLSGGLRNAARGIDGLNRSTANTQRALGKFSGNIQRGVAIGLAATTAGFVGVVRAAADYESAFAGVRKTVEATEPQLEALSDAIRKMSREIPISAAELARLGEAGGALGIATADLEEFIRVTALLGETTDLTADEAATSLGTLSNVLKLTGDEYDNFASTLVALGNAGASTESQIIQLAERMGAAGELIGLSTEQVLGFASAAASLGIEAEAGGSSFQKFFIETTKAVADGGDKLKVYAKISGQTTKEFARAFDEDAGGALQRFLKGLGKLDQAGQLRALKALGLDEIRITRLLLGLGNNAELVADQLNIANSAFEKNSALTKEAGERFKTFDSQLQLAKNSLTDIGITIGSKLLPKLVPLLQRFNEFVNQNQGKIEEFGTNVANAFGKFADEIQRTDFSPLVDGLRTSFEIAKQAVGMFNALPDPIKKMLIAGAAVNKVTGGLITGLGKDILGTLGSQFLARGSSPANPLFVTGVGVGGLGGPGSKGGKGALPGLGALGILGALGFLDTQRIGSPSGQFNNRQGVVSVKDILAGQKLDVIATSTQNMLDANARRGGSAGSVPTQVDQATQQLGGANRAELQRIFQYGVEQGFKPTAASIIATFERNATRTPPWVANMEAANDRRAGSAAVGTANTIAAIQTQGANDRAAYMSAATNVAGAISTRLSTEHASDRAAYMTAATSMSATVSNRLSTEGASNRAAYMSAASGVSMTLATQHASDRTTYMSAASGVSRNVLSAGSLTAGAARTAGEVAARGARDGGNAAATAIRAKKLSTTVNTTVPVSLTTGATFINGRLFQNSVTRQQTFARTGQFFNGAR
jgi:TP901 family phage tail tape measure protein